MPKHLILGAVSSTLFWDEIAPFCNSYSQAGFENCECIIFTGKLPEHTLNKIHDCGIKTIPIPERFNGQSIMNFRWELFRDYLSERVNDYDIVFAAGCRDVIFQSDVFKYYENTGKFLGAALEDAYLINAVLNKRWLVDRYGTAVWESMKDNRILCADTIWGTAQEFLSFTSAMTAHLNSDEYDKSSAVDQAAENWLIYHEKFLHDVVRTSANEDGYVMTIGITDPKDVHTDSAGNVLNGKGEIASVVHQYDRQPAILDIVVRKYGADMSAFSKLKLKHNCDKLGRIMRFMSRIHRRGLFRSVLEAVKRRI